MFVLVCDVALACRVDVGLCLLRLLYQLSVVCMKCPLGCFDGAWCMVCERPC